MRFYKCKECNHIIAISDDCVELHDEFVEVKPNTTEAAHEKHIPVVEKVGNIVKVKVGEVLHPMLDNHYIGWVILETKFGNQRKVLSPNHEPVVEFALVDGDEVVRAISYCNLHGLWSTK